LIGGKLTVKFKYKDEWLPHLKDSVSSDAGIPGISLYTIALEGWRRGLTLNFFMDQNINKKKTLKYKLANETHKHCFDDSSGDLNSELANEICGDKGLTNKYLEKKHVPIPRGKAFDNSVPIEEMISYAKTIKYPLVVKPIDGLGGKGVIVNIKNEKALVKAIRYVKEKLSFQNIIVQEFVEGEEVRIYVLNGRILGAVNRIPANIVGDGKNSIVNLIDEKNEYRKNFPHLQYRPIRIDNELRELIEDAGYTLDSVLRKDERLFLKKISNVSIGGDPVDITDQLSDEQRKIALTAVDAVPGLNQCGVDMMINERTGKGVIIELNASPGIGSHLFPMKGQARDIPKEIIDYYFPESKEQDISNSKLYYNLRSTSQYLHDGILSEVEISQHPTGKTYGKMFILNSDMRLFDIYSNVKKYIFKQRFNGFMQMNKNGNIEIVLRHVNEKSLDKFKTFLKEIKSDLKIYDIECCTWNKPVKLGFELIDGRNTMSVMELENEHKQSFREIRVLEKEVKRLQRRIELMKKSRAWRLTAPIRFVKDVINRLN